ncbi:MAG: ATP-binding protein [Myxococcota bacterium]
MSRPLVIRLRNRVEELRRVPAALEKFAITERLPLSLLGSLSLVIEEVVCNIVFHAYEDDAEHEIELRLAVEGDALTLEVEDDGRDFDPFSVPAPDLGAPLPVRPVGGLGIALIRRLMDEVRHERRRGRNLLTLTKRGVREA